MTNKDQDQYIYLPMKNCVRTRYNFESRCFEQMSLCTLDFVETWHNVPSSWTNWYEVTADEHLVDQLVSILVDRESDC